uniref:Uncharacterized protein n=1 Tax=Candidatus Methanophagaceae archaeon ANME-1 ERB6 TaxID=2759912 RepID=A0A7G9YZY2_9EURY|nr:hypothetical protein BBDCAPAO_00003 [Methanosarcinales archaeon ANME-1 ERB6]
MNDLLKLISGGENEGLERLSNNYQTTNRYYFLHRYKKQFFFFNTPSLYSQS